MDPSGGSSPWWAADPPSYSDQQSSPSSQPSSGDVPYPMPVQVQMSYNHTSQDPAQKQPVSEGPVQIQQERQQKPPSRSSLIEGRCSWTAAEPPSYPDQQAAHSSQWVNGDVHQRMVQPPGYSRYSMPVRANYIQQPDTDSDFIHFDGSAFYYQNSSGLYQLMFGEVPRESVAVGQENQFYPLTNGNNPEKASSPDEGYSSSGTAVYQAKSEPAAAESQYEQMDSLPGAGSPECAELNVQCPQPIDFNDGQNLDEPILEEQYNHTSQEPDEGQVELARKKLYQRRQEPPSNKTPVVYNFFRRAVKKRSLKNTPYQCLICKDFFESNYGLTQHQVSIHTDRPFRCTKCGKRFASQEVLDNHFKKHNAKDKPFKCPLCPKQFFLNNDLRRHSYRHTGITPHRCNVCSHYFSRKDHLLNHQQSKICRKMKQPGNTKN